MTLQIILCLQRTK